MDCPRRDYNPFTEISNPFTECGPMRSGKGAKWKLDCRRVDFAKPRLLQGATELKLGKKPRMGKARPVSAKFNGTRWW